MQAAFESPTEIVRKLDRFIVGQRPAKQALAAAVYRHYLGLAHRDRYRSGPYPFGRPHVLLIGPTGAGKTYLVETLARIVQAPFCYFSATNLVEAGYVGDHVDSLFLNLLSRTRGDLDRAHRGIIFIDEIDKIRRQDLSGRDISGEGVQSALLPILDGTPQTVRTRNECYDFDPSMMLFICAGAFVGLDRIVCKRMGRHEKIGFSTSNEVARKDDDVIENLNSEDLESFGMIPEFIGRFPTITSLKTLTETQIAEILRKSEGSCYKRQQKLFQAHGIKLELIDDAIRLIAQRAVAASTNARGIDKELNRVLTDIAARLPELSAEGVNRVLVDAGTITGANEPILQKNALADFTRPSEAEMLRRDAWSLIRNGVLQKRERNSRVRESEGESFRVTGQSKLPF